MTWPDWQSRRGSVQRCYLPEERIAIGYHEASSVPSSSPATLGVRKTVVRISACFPPEAVFDVLIHRVNLEESADKISLVALFYFGKLAHILVLGETVKRLTTHQCIGCWSLLTRTHQLLTPEARPKARKADGLVLGISPTTGFRLHRVSLVAGHYLKRLPRASWTVDGRARLALAGHVKGCTPFSCTRSTDYSLG
jgi:hypothetical protein